MFFFHVCSSVVTLTSVDYSAIRTFKDETIKKKCKKINFCLSRKPISGSLFLSSSTPTRFIFSKSEAQVEKKIVNDLSKVNILHSEWTEKKKINTTSPFWISVVICGVLEDYGPGRFGFGYINPIEYMINF